MYVIRSEIETEIPPQHLVAAFDDDRDGTEDPGAFDAAVEAVGTEIDGYLSGKYNTPFTEPAPPAVRAAAKVFLGELVYSRRELAEGNPFATRAKAWRDRLKMIGDGKAPLDANIEALVLPGVAITETLKTYASTT